MSEVSSSPVLLVDDEASIRDLLSIHLENAGFQAIHAEDGIDAIVKLRSIFPKVIISDLNMPRMSGFEFIGIVRRRFPTIPIIALTGSFPSEFAVETEPDYWFEKSIQQFPDLVQVVRDLAQKAPDPSVLPQVDTTPVRIRPGFAGYFMLTCTDCQRTFKATHALGNKSADGTADCAHCDARVPYLIESPEAESHKPAVAAQE
jgi:CheY-like chemotaxis protein